MEKEFILARALSEEIKKIKRGRQIIFWGGWEPNCKLKDELISAYHIDFEYYLTIVKSKITDENINKNNLKKMVYTDFIQGKADQFLIVSFVRETDDYIKQFLKLGYTNGRDILFIYPKPVEVTANYQDWRGNKVEGVPKNCKISIAGFGNQISLKNVDCIEKLSISVGSFSNIHISGTKIERETSFFIRDLIGGQKKTEVHIHENCIFRGGSFAIYSGYFEAHKNCTFGKNFQVTVGNGMSIIIERDCMFSHDIYLLSGDGHAIYDVKTGICVNDPKTMTDAKRKIIIGEHVWVGLRSVIINGTSIGNGSIVGANSFVKGEFTNNCILAGNPAKLIRKDIAWSREPVSTDISSCGEAYINLSQESVID